MMIGVLLYRIAEKKVMEMVLTGRRVPAVEAEKMGLITRAVILSGWTWRFKRRFSCWPPKAPSQSGSARSFQNHE